MWERASLDRTGLCCRNRVRCARGCRVHAHIWVILRSPLGFPGGSDSKELPAMQETRVQCLGQEGSLEKGMASHSSILDWRISWTEEPGGLQSKGLQRVTYDLETKLPFTFTLSKAELQKNRWHQHGKELKIRILRGSLLFPPSL